jgi:hypothetical protein
MRLALRDDDTNYYTSPETLEECYKDVWSIVPPSLSLISKVKGNWSYWVHQIYKDKDKTDWNLWREDDHVYPIENNKDLIEYLNEKLKEGKIDLCFHAKHHRNEDPVLPQAVEANYIHGAEFYTSRDLSNYIATEVAHLSRTFNYNISVFTPPQNLLSLEGYKSVLKAGLNVCGGGISFYKKEKTLQGLRNMQKQLLFKGLHRGKDYPFVLRFSNHTEIPYHYPLQPNTDLKDLIRQFEMVRSFDGDFVLSTHYVEFNYKMVNDQSKTMKNILEEFLDYTKKYKINYTTLSDLLRNH